MKSSMIFWLVSVLILSIAIDCAKTMKPKVHQKQSGLIEKNQFAKEANSTSEEEQLGKLGHARHHKGKRVVSTPSLRSENDTSVLRQSPHARIEIPSLRQRNPRARNEFSHNPSLRAPQFLEKKGHQWLEIYNLR